MTEHSPASEAQSPLDPRKSYILATVVYEYIETGEPVGSQTLTQKYNLGVSPATVRNEMSDLEEAGYLVQPHTSAGRVPSDSGYRTYVDKLMEPQKLAPTERKRIEDELRDASRELDEMIEHATRVLGRLSNSLAFLTQPNSERVAAAGTQNLLDQPEFHDLSKLRSILRIIEEQKTLYDLVADAMSAPTPSVVNVPAPSVKIGHELGSEELNDLSVVTVPYRFGPHATGMLSILGPRRMPYARLMALAAGTAETLSEHLSKINA